MRDFGKKSQRFHRNFSMKWAKIRPKPYFLIRSLQRNQEKISTKQRFCSAETTRKIRKFYYKMREKPSRDLMKIDLRSVLLT